MVDIKDISTFTRFAAEFIVSLVALMLFFADSLGAFFQGHLLSLLMVFASYCISYFITLRLRLNKSKVLYYATHTYLIIITATYFLAKSIPAINLQPILFNFNIANQLIGGFSRVFVDGLLIAVVISSAISVVFWILKKETFWADFPIRTILLFCMAIFGILIFSKNPAISTPFLGKNAVLDYLAQQVIGLPALVSIGLLTKWSVLERQQHKEKQL